MHGLQEINHTNSVNPASVANQFLMEYYRGNSYVGWNMVAYLFDTNCIVYFKENLFNNFYDFINYISSENIKRANYGFIKSKWFVISSDIMLINTIGTLQFVSFNNLLTNILPFSEIFILKINKNNVVKCTHHNMNIISV